MLLRRSFLFSALCARECGGSICNFTNYLNIIIIISRSILHLCTLQSTAKKSSSKKKKGSAKKKTPTKKASAKKTSTKTGSYMKTSLLLTSGYWGSRYCALTCERRQSIMCLFLSAHSFLMRALNTLDSFSHTQQSFCRLRRRVHHSTAFITNTTITHTPLSFPDFLQ